MKIKHLILCALLLFVTGCSNNLEIEEDNNFEIVTSFYPVFVFTQNIVKDIPNVNVTNMTDNHSGCLHDYYLTTNDMKLIDRADALVINGAGLESFLEKVYNTNTNLEVIDSSENVELVQEKFSNDDNEHIWLSISNAIIQVKNIGENLALLDDENADLYLTNMNEYIKKLEILRNDLRESMYGYSDVKMVTSHDAYPYLADDFGFEIISVIEKEEGTSPTSKEMEDIINKIRQEDVKSIFIEKDSSNKIATTIATESGSRVYELDTITSGDGSLEDYENRMRKNIEVIKESL